MMMNKKISIIVPIFKVEKYIHRCIDSIIKQDYHDIEIILVDDGSPDKCGNIIDEYAKIDTRIIVVHQPNGGLSAARNKGIELAHGDFLMFIDGDDFVESDFCSSALNAAVQNNCDIVVFGFNYIYDNDKLNRALAYKQGEVISVEVALSELHGGKIRSYAWNKIYKANLFQKIRYPENRLYEDIGTTYLLFHEAKSIFLSPKITYNYIQRSDSIIGRKYIPKDSIDMFELSMQRFLFMKNYYPNILNKVWKDYAEIVLLCCKIICKNNGCKIEYDRMLCFMKKYKSNILKSGLEDKELKLLYFSPNLFSFYQKAKLFFLKIFEKMFGKC